MEGVFGHQGRESWWLECASVVQGRGMCAGLDPCPSPGSSCPHLRHLSKSAFSALTLYLSPCRGVVCVQQSCVSPSGPRSRSITASVFILLTTGNLGATGVLRRHFIPGVFLAFLLL